jgi:hypothetical protein
MSAIKHELALALQEVGTIRPWFSDVDGFWVFSHTAYPTVDYMGDTPEDTITGYTRILEAFLCERLNGTVAGFVDQLTVGRGGKRVGAGRPIGSVKTPSLRISVPTDIANWLKGQPDHWEQVRKLMG